MTLDEQRKNYDEAQAGATAFAAWQEARGIPPIHIAGAAAVLIGRIVGTVADDQAHVEQGLEHLLKVMRLTASDYLAAQQMKH
jgi:hypothetical protein